MTRRSLPLSVRLVVTYGFLIAATLLIVAALVVHLTRSHLARELDAQVLGIADSFSAGPADQIDSPDQIAQAVREWLSQRALPEDQLAAVRIPDNDVPGDRVLTFPGAMDREDVEGSDVLLRAETSGWYRVSGPDGPVRALTVPLELQGDQVGTLLVAASEGDSQRTVSALLVGIGWASLAGLLVAAMLGFALVRRTLRPLRRISEEVEAIQQTGDLTRRVAYEGPADEVGKLASVFDEMIGKLDEAFSSQRLFLGDASHELRTPLTIVRGQLELLQQEGLSPQGTRSVNVGLDEVDRMSRIVEDLLLLARLDEGLSMKSEPVEVELVLQESLVRAKAIADRTVGVDAEEGVFILGDFDRLLQVISNLVSNAIRHAGDGASLTLKSKREDGSVRIEVTDTGRGIAPEDISRVFDRLYRGAGPQTDSPAGAGLGLAIAASLVEAMKGTIVVSSTLGVGTTFTLMFPETRVPDSSPSEWSSGSAARDSLSS